LTPSTATGGVRVHDFQRRPSAAIENGTFMATADYDLFIIGAGSGGVRAGRLAAQRGARVAVAESAALGGTCVNLGCIPKKLYSFAAHYAEAFEEARGFGWNLGAPSFDWQALKRNRAVEIARLNDVYDKLLGNAGVTLFDGRARLVGPDTVEVGGKTYRATRILVATGGWPVPPELPGGELAISSNEVFDLPEFPRRLIVGGGGYIACEFASIFRGLGAEVTQLYRGDQILRGFDDDVRAFVADEMRKKGVDLRTHAQVERIERVGGALRATLASGDTLDADTGLYAAGRRPNTAGLGLEAAGVALSETGAVVVDANYRSNVPSIYAIGDVTDRVKLTPVALAEAIALVEHLYGDGRRDVDYALIPTAVFTNPNIGTIGVSERFARKNFDRVSVYRSEFRPLRHTLSGSTERTLMKLVVDDATDRVIGLHMVGADAGEIVQGFAVAMKAGATKAVFDATLGIHPTAAEEFVTMREPVVA
jgi:glutathione reductase (NADPH)